MPQPTTRPYGEWSSPISADLVAQGELRLVDIVLDGEDVYWIESRPDDNGVHVVVRRRPGGAPEDVTPRGFSARSLVNDYGGGSLAVSGGTIWFSNFSPADHPDTSDQRIFRQDPGMQPVAITSAVPMRYADGALDLARRLMYCVREDHTASLHGQPKQALVALDLDGRRLPKVLAEGSDFYANPRLSPDGRRLCWTAWDYPCMPWDGTRLYVAEVGEDGTLAGPRCLAGERPAAASAPNPVPGRCTSDEAIIEPLWSPAGDLYFLSDRVAVEDERWWNICRARDAIEPVTRLAAEFGGPQWTLGMAHYGFESERSIIAAYTRDGLWRLARVAVETGEVRDFQLDYTSIGQVRVGAGFAVFVAASFERPPAIVRLDLASGETEVLRSALDLGPAERATISVPEAITFATEGGPPAQGHAFYYRPRNPAYEAPAGEQPPLVIRSHGGPTAAANSALDLEIQYFTSRGFAVVDVNYRGSTGFGRAYRRSLYGNWGIYDVADCRAAALQLAGATDPYRIVARGGSSGGYTTLALATFTDLLSAATSYYGISNLEMIAVLTDKLEADYAALLIGPWPVAQKLFQKALALLPGRPDRLPRCDVPGLPRPDRAAPAGQGDARDPAAEGPAGRLPVLPEREPRLSDRRQRPALPGERAVVLRPDHGLHAGRPPDPDPARQLAARRPARAGGDRVSVRPVRA
jgi:dipeptidyl aminopeptidase/acylaminoacyl peptidase